MPSDRERVAKMLEEMTAIGQSDPRLPPTPDQLLRWQHTTRDVLALLQPEADRERVDDAFSGLDGPVTIGWLEDGSVAFWLGDPCSTDAIAVGDGYSDALDHFEDAILNLSRRFRWSLSQEKASRYRLTYDDQEAYDLREYVRKLCQPKGGEPSTSDRERIAIELLRGWWRHYRVTHGRPLESIPADSQAGRTRDFLAGADTEARPVAESVSDVAPPPGAASAGGREVKPWRPDDDFAGQMQYHIDRLMRAPRPIRHGYGGPLMVDSRDVEHAARGLQVLLDRALKWEMR